MLTTVSPPVGGGVGPLSFSSHYTATLTSPGNQRSASMHRGNKGLVAVQLPLAAECKMVQLHQKPVLDIRMKPVLSANSVVSVYNPPHHAVRNHRTRTSSDMSRSTEHKGGHNKKRSSSNQPRIVNASRPFLQKRVSSSEDRPVTNVSEIRRSMPAASTSSPNSLVRRSSNIVHPQQTTSTAATTTTTMDKNAVKVFLSQKQSPSIKDCGTLVPSAPPATPTPGKGSMAVCRSRGYRS
jgi:hypothetical protein